LPPAICNFRPPYGFFIGQHIVAVTDAEDCEETSILKCCTRQTRCRITDLAEEREGVNIGILLLWRSLGDQLGIDGRCRRGNRKLLLKIIEAVSCVATASPLLFDFFYYRRVCGSSGIDLVRFRFRLSYAR
jgi:hypothetical protein